MAARTPKDVLNPVTPIVIDARATTSPKKNFLLTLSEICPATNPKEAYGKV